MCAAASKNDMPTQNTSIAPLTADTHRQPHFSQTTDKHAQTQNRHDTGSARFGIDQFRWHVQRIAAAAELFLWCFVVDERND